MQYSMNPLIALPIAVMALGSAIGIWYYLLRPVPELIQPGTIEKIEFGAKEKIIRTEMRGMRNTDDLIRKKEYILPDRFIYTIKLEDGRLARYQENATHEKANPEHNIGQRMSVNYQLRQLPFGKEKITVTEINPL